MMVTTRLSRCATRSHPFGGFNMSGTDSKAGGRDYLGLFLQGKSVAEKLGEAPSSPSNRAEE